MATQLGGLRIRLFSSLYILLFLAILAQSFVCYVMLSYFPAIGKPALLLFSYVFINTSIFAAIGYFRLEKNVVKPLQKVLSLAEDASSMSSSYFSLKKTRGPFKDLSIRLTAMVSQMREDNKSLEETVARLDSTNRELVANQNALVQSEKIASLGRLAAGMAHEIGNPLAIIQGYIDILQQGLDTNQNAPKYLGKVDQELDRIKLLLGEMGDLANPVAREKEYFNVVELFEEMLSFAALDKRVKKCQPAIREDCEALRLFAEKDSLRQILLNCLFNAADSYLDFSADAGKRPISFGVYKVKEASIQIEIADQGKGIEQEAIPLLFEPFYTTKDQGKGSGLGLFISGLLVSRMGGQMIYHQNAPHGTLVVIELPHNL